MATILVGLAVAALAALALRKIIADKRAGKGCCGDCAKCRGCH